MRAKSLTLGFSLAAAGVVIPFAAFAQAPAPAPAAPPPAAAPAPGAAAPAPGAAAPAPAPATPPPAEPAPAPAPPPAAAAPAAPVEAAPPPAPAEAAAPPAEEAPKEAPPPLATVTGYVDGAYHMNLSKLSNDYTVPLRSYDSVGGNSFLLHAAHIGVAHSFSPETSVFVSLDFGSDAMINNAGYTPSTLGVAVTPAVPATATTPAVPEQRKITFGIPADVREAYAQWTPGDFLLKAGKFVTLNGIEVVDGPLNPTITRGFLYGLAEPVTHTGAKIQYTIAGMAHIGLGLVNGWDNIVDTNNKKTLLFNADVAPSPTFHAQISGSWGAEQPNVDDNPRTTIDLTGAVVLDSLTLNFQGLYGAEGKSGFADANGPQDNSWWGLGLQPVFTMDMFSIGGRLEYMADKHGGRTFAGAADDVSIFNFTITPGITPTKGFTLRAEYRVDAVLGAKQVDPASNTLVDSKDLLNGKSSQHTIAIGAHYIF